MPAGRRASSAPAARRTRCAASAGTCRPAAPSSARSRRRPRAGARSARASSGCRRRRRSAAASASMMRRTTFCERPARGGSTTTTSGLPDCSSSSRITSRTSPAKKLRVVHAVQLGVLDRVGHRLLDQLDAPDLAGVEREHERDRADAAEQVEHLLAAGQAGELRGARRRGARPSRCWSGRRRRARCGSAGPRAPPRAWPRPLSDLRLAAARGLGHALGARPQERVGRRRGGQLVDAEVEPGLVTTRAWSWPVRRPSRTTRLRSRPVWSRRSQAARPSSRHQAFTASRSSSTRSEARMSLAHVVDQVPAAGAVEAEHELARRRPRRTSTRACCGSGAARRRARSARPAGPRSRRCARARRATCASFSSSWRS